MGQLMNPITATLQHQIKVLNEILNALVDQAGGELRVPMRAMEASGERITIFEIDPKTGDYLLRSCHRPI